MTLLIRLATIDDTSAVAELNRFVQELHSTNEPTEFRPWDRAASEAFFQDQSRRSDCVLLLAEEAGQAVGYLWARATGTRLDALRTREPAFVVEHIAVAPDARRLGVGTGLMARAEQEARSRGIGRMELDYWTFNQGAATFFGKLGFAPYNVRARRTL